MKKKISLRAKLAGLAMVMAGAAAIAPVAVPQTVMAETVTASDTTGMYEIIRNINIYYVNDDGTTTPGGSVAQKGYVSNKNMKYTFPQLVVKDFFGGNLGYWKPDKDVIPSVTATYGNNPADVDIYLSKDASKLVEETKTITRSVRYYNVDASGNRSNAGSYSDGVTFKRYGYKDENGNKVMDDWSGDYTFKELKVDPKNGYTANMQKVPSKTVTPSDSDFTVEVLYTKIPTRTETKTIKRTIDLVGRNTDGSTSSLGQAIQTVTLNREVYTDTDGSVKVVRDWNAGKMEEYKVPDRSGYTKQQDEVPELAVDSNSKNTSVDVIYVQQKNGFTLENNKVYYYNNDTKLTGTHLINGFNYTFDSTGRLISEPFGVNVGKAGRPLVVVKDGWYTISSAANPGYSLDVRGGKAANKTNLELYKTKDIIGQKFYIKSIGNNEYVIYTGTNNMKSVIDIAGKKTTIDTNVWQYKFIDVDAQKWRIVGNTDGSVTFIAKNSGLALDITGAKYQNRTNIRMWKVNYNQAENFILKKTTAPQ